MNAKEILRKEAGVLYTVADREVRPGESLSFPVEQELAGLEEDLARGARNIAKYEGDDDITFTVVKDGILIERKDSI